MKKLLTLSVIAFALAASNTIVYSMRPQPSPYTGIATALPKPKPCPYTGIGVQPPKPNK